MKEKKILQVVNLSPSESWIEKLTEVHPMKQITFASILQVLVFGFMLLSFFLISIATEAEPTFDFEEIERDGKLIEEYNNKNRMVFDMNKPSHEYYFWINLADVATTIYAIEKRDNLYEGNFLLDDEPELNELLLQKVLVSYAFHEFGLFSETETAEDILYLMNAMLTVAVISNYRLIQVYD